VAVAGITTSIAGFALSIYLVYARLVRDITVSGWTSVAVMVLVLSGAVLFALGVIAEYVGVAVRMAMGRPPYLTVRDPRDGPLARVQSVVAASEAMAESEADADSRLLRSDVIVPDR
jgi:undecaprenyl-phosphate 4-deoxy-4-formamido-L-arabinose transferase